MGRGRPRKIRPENTPTNGNQPVVTTPVSKAAFLPYQGKDSLPTAVVDKRGRVKKAGEARYFLNGNSNVGYKLIAVYRSVNGVSRKLARVLKTRSQGTERGARDRAFLEDLKKMGIPGY